MNAGNRSIKDTTFLLLNILIPLILGALIYVLSKETHIYEFLTKLGMEEIQRQFFIPRIIRNFGCDFLWAYSLAFSIQLVIGKRSGFQFKVIIFEIVVCLMLEFSQLLPFFHSTFDPMDCLVETIAVLTANGIIYLFFRRGE